MTPRKTTAMKKHRISWGIFVMTCMASALVQAAPATPDAGQLSRELEKLPAMPKSTKVNPLRVEGEAVAPGLSSTEIRFTVKSIRVTGSTVFAAADLEALVADLTGAVRSLAELDAGVARITAYYRERGYLVARAYLPVQDIRDGAVLVKVLEGMLDKQRIRNQSSLPDALAQRYMAGVEAGAVLQSQPVDRALLLLGDTPGVGGARAALQPGASVGTTELLLELDPAQAYAANVEMDNYGNRYTGANRLGASIDVNSPLNMGDLLSLRALSSGPNMQYARLAYQLPIGVSGLKLGGAYYDTRYKLGESFAATQAHGTASSSSLFVTYPFVRSLAANLYGSLTWEYKKLQDQTDAVVSNVQKQVKLVTVGLSGNRQDVLWGGGSSSFSMALATGQLGMDADSLVNDSLSTSANSHGAFSKFIYSARRQQALGSGYSMLLSLNGQQASKNLNSSEKFSLGGALGVRAYPQGEGAGDQGVLVNLDLQRNLTAQWQGVVFYDLGQVDINRTPFAAGSNTRTLGGVGFGLNGQIEQLQFKTSVAWRTRGGDPLSDTAKRNPRLWLQLGLPL
jgi:hemolysin activation/secretion protein